MIKNYIFDFDGTVADTIGGIVATMQETFRLHGREIPSVDDIKGVIGLRLDDCMRGLGIADEGEVTELCATYRRIFPDIAMSKIELFPEVKETLTELHKQGKRLAIATSRNKHSLTEIMKRHGVLDYFDLLVSASDGYAPKPAPDMVLGILDKLGINESETLVIGDTTFDIDMGNKAHCWTCAVTYGNHTRERLMTAQPNFIVDNFCEVLSCKNTFLNPIITIDSDNR